MQYDLLDECKILKPDKIQDNIPNNALNIFTYGRLTVSSHHIHEL